MATIQAVKIPIDIARFFSALDLYSAFIPSRTPSKPFITLATASITFPNPAKAFEKFVTASASCLVIAIIPTATPNANTLLQSILLAHSRILFPISDNIGHISELPYLRPKQRPAIANAPIAYIIRDGE